MISVVSKRLYNSSFLRHASSHAQFKYCVLPNKSYLHIKGPDTVKFINGLISSKMLPTYVKKNLTTISVDDESPSEHIAVKDFDMTQGNWGVFKEFGENGPYISRFGTYTGLLNSKGKLITDAIIYPIPMWVASIEERRYPEYLVEVDQNISEQMDRTFNSHTLVSKVKCRKEPAGKLKTWYLSIAFPDGASEENPWISNLIEPMERLKAPEASLQFAKHVLTTFFAGSEHKILGCFIDPRVTESLYEHSSAPQVFRVVTKADVTDLSDIFNAPEMPFEFHKQQINVSDVRHERFAYGFVDGLADFKQETVLPLELNFDFIPNAVSFDKGCYVGQELTARTFATGILRKRAVPVILDGWQQLLEVDLQSEKYLRIYAENSGDQALPVSGTSGPFEAKASKTKKRLRPAGSLLCFERERGVAILRTEYFADAFGGSGSHSAPEFYIEVPQTGQTVKVIPQRPRWYEEWQEGEE
ncbi:LANO_0H24520g1_1 [Lachancea nothofagi CBS 11611]|uniref:LANO_0H24520g1_1 n=1 Tax=Lachancea nothofagi CBS 11611 TaxID=1266666 RepID=A0A1G4KNS9_9SACH|nr:LANO_0H24520g1_1 [Lachancea nothofagi CBS 11611]